MKQHESREKLEAVLDYLDPHNKDINPLQRLIVRKFQKVKDEDDKENIELEAFLTPDIISIVLQKIQVQVLLDVRDVLYDLLRESGVTKWGSKLSPASSDTKTTEESPKSHNKKTTK